MAYIHVQHCSNNEIAIGVPQGNTVRLTAQDARKLAGRIISAAKDAEQASRRQRNRRSGNFRSA